jgi:hypothetical protein
MSENSKDNALLRAIHVALTDKRGKKVCMYKANETDTMSVKLMFTKPSMLRKEVWKTEGTKEKGRTMREFLEFKGFELAEPTPGEPHMIIVLSHKE